jgi:hypothetical protein
MTARIYVSCLLEYVEGNVSVQMFADQLTRSSNESFDMNFWSYFKPEEIIVGGFTT